MTQPRLDQEPWLTKREVAERLRVSVSTVERHISPTICVGGQNRYYMSQVEAQLSGHEEALPDNVIALRPRRTEVAA